MLLIRCKKPLTRKKNGHKIAFIERMVLINFILHMTSDH